MTILLNLVKPYQLQLNCISHVTTTVTLLIADILIKYTTNLPAGNSGGIS